MKYKYIIITIILLLTIGIIYGLYNRLEKEEANWKDFNLVMHALGAIHGNTHTNTKEALMENYIKGGRVFEVDLYLTSDGRLVAIHPTQLLNRITNQAEVSSDYILNHDFFKERNLTPLSFVDIANLMIEHPDIFLITDTKRIDKETVQKQFSYIYQVANQKDPEILNRIIPQIYTTAMYQYIEEIYSFNEYIWTLYKTPGISNQEIFNFLSLSSKITVITMPYDVPRLTREFILELDNRNILVYVHPVDNITKMDYLYNFGVWGFYTAFITEDYIKRHELLRHQEQVE